MEIRSSVFLFITVIFVTLLFSAYARLPAEVHEEHLLGVHHDDVDAHDSEESNFQCVKRTYLKGDGNAEKVKRSAEMRNVYDDLETTLEYGREESKTRQPPADGDRSEGSIYDSPPSETAEVLGSDRKETGVTVTDKFDAEINQSENETVVLDVEVETKSLPSQELVTVDTTTDNSLTDKYNYTKNEYLVQLDDPVQLSPHETKEEGMYSPILLTQSINKAYYNTHTNDENQGHLDHKGNLSAEETSADFIVKEQSEPNISLTQSVYNTFYNPKDENQGFVDLQDNLTTKETSSSVIVEKQSESKTEVVTVATNNNERFYNQGDMQTADLTDFTRLNSKANVTISSENPLVGQNEILDSKSMPYTIAVSAQEEELGTTDTTTSTPLEVRQTSLYDVSEDETTSHPPVIESKVNEILTNDEKVLGPPSDVLRLTKQITSEKEYFDLFDEPHLNSTSKKLDDEIPPNAERLYSSYIERYDTDKYLADTVEKTRDFEKDKKIMTSNTQALRDYEDKTEEDSVIIKSLLEDYPSFKKEKIEPGTLIEECSDCDIRILPIRPSQQRSTPEFETESPPKARIKFSELPEGAEIQITKLGLSDGIFFFSYLSQFLSWIQPNEFPVDLLRDALRNQITWISLITQSLQVEAGFVACLVVGVLLALAVPVVVLSHACYRMGGRQEDSEEAAGWAGNCKRRTLVFILQLLLILLFAGMVAMFVTNEQLSSAVVQSPDVLQTSLSDVSAFVHNSHLQLHFLVSQSTDQALQAINADLDNVDTLLGRPIQREMVRETGLDVAVETLSDLTRETSSITQQVDRFQDEVRVTQEMLVSSREKLSDLRQQVELFRRACGTRDRMLCDTIDASGLDIVLRLDRLKSDDRLNRMRRMGGVGLEIAMAEAKDHFTSVPSRVDADTRDAREGVRRLLSKQREEIEDKSEALEKFAREVTNKVNEAKYHAGFWMQDLDQFEYWRWIVCLGGGAAVLMIWMMLLCSMCCGCCGSERAAGPTILLTIVLVCLFSTALWLVVMMGLLVGGHGEVFVCRPLYDQPDYPVISNLVDQPGVLYNQQRGGFIANVIYGNDTLDVPIRDVLQECQNNRPIYSTLGLQRVFDVEHAVDQHQWDGVSAQMRTVRANLSSLEVLSPVLQQQLTDLLSTLSVNFTEHRIQMSRPVTGKDMDSFARQLDNIGNQLRDLATASRMETLSSRTRRLIDSHIRPLEVKKDSLVYQLTALEVQTGPLQKQVNQSLSHLKTIQFFINNQVEAIAHTKSREYVDRMLSYLNQLRQHVVESVKNSVAPCRPLWEIFNSTRLFLCRHTMDPLNGYWFATMWCLLVLLIATPVCLKLVDYYRAQGSATSGSPESLIPDASASWSSPGYDVKRQNEYVK